MRDGISMARGNNGVIMRALLAPVISRGTLILVQTFIRSNRNDIFISFEKLVESLSSFSSSSSSSTFCDASLFLETPKITIPHDADFILIFYLMRNEPR